LEEHNANTTIRKAMPGDSAILTTISFAAKGYWQYPQEYYELWRDELTISSTYIEQHEVYLAETAGVIVGYCSLVEVEKDYLIGKVVVNHGFWLDHLFLLPEFIGKGIGTRLVQFIKDLCREKKIEKLQVFVEPKAKGFYDKIGAVYLRESASSIAGRTLPVYIINIDQQI